MPKRARMIEKSQLRPGSRLKTQHKVFISFHNCDLKWKERFVEEMERRIIDESVDTGEIVDSNKKVADVRRIIREDYIRPASVTVVLIGPKTWQRKHVDWEIGASLLARNHKRRHGLMGIALPDHPSYGSERIKPNLIPPRLADNCYGDDPFAKIYDWPEPFAPAQVQRAIAEAFSRREGAYPDNNREPFVNNWSGPWDRGWQ